MGFDKALLEVGGRALLDRAIGVLREACEEVLLAWSEWIRDVPEELTSVGRILQVPDVPFAPEPLRDHRVEPALLEPL